LGKDQYFENHINFTFLIKGIAFGRALYGANTFSTRNPLPDPKIWFFTDLSYFHGFP